MMASQLRASARPRQQPRDGDYVPMHEAGAGRTVILGADWIPSRFALRSGRGSGGG